MISIVIGHKQNSEERKDNLKFLINYYNNMLIKEKIEFEILIVEQDVSSKIDFPIKNGRVFFCYNNGEYNRAWSLNIGVVNSKYDSVLCLDNDIILPLDTFLNGLDQINKNKNIYVPYEYFLDMNKDVTSSFKQNLDFNYLKSELRKGITDRYNWVSSDNQYKFGGCFFTNKNFYVSISGMDENCRGWGAEDEAFFFKYSKVLEHYKKDWKPRSKTHEIYHLYHDRINMAWVGQQEFYKKNVSIMEKIRNMSYDNLMLYITEQKKDFGNIYKYR
jgi:predicted glycosyltransferase involved in capsule biosynthesis